MQISCFYVKSEICLATLVIYWLYFYQKNEMWDRDNIDIVIHDNSGMLNKRMNEKTTLNMIYLPDT